MPLHPLQSIYWEKARQKMGIKTVRINNFLISLHPLNFFSFKIGYLPRSSFPDKDTLEKLFKFGKENNLIFIKIEPYEKKSKIKLNHKNLVESPHPLFPKWTQIIDLRKSEEEIFNSFHHKTRYNIRLAQKKGVVVKEESNNQGFEIFIKLYFQTCQRQKYYGHDYRYHQIIWQNFKNKVAHILTAYYKNIPLASYQLWYMDKIIYYPYGGTSTLYRNLMASNLLMWEAIKLGKKLKAETFDMWGSLPPKYHPNHPWAGFTRFKQGYGTIFFEFVGSFDLVINPFFYQIYNILYQIRNLYLKFKTLTFL